MGHGVCAAVCPTGALGRYTAPGFRGIDFDAASCIACGVCVVVCPEQALTLERQPGEHPARGRERISRHGVRACARCDNEYRDDGTQDICPNCRKDVALFTHGFQPRSEQS
jgi:Fe-S-cluster-containing hydrogenase component 2